MHGEIYLSICKIFFIIIWTLYTAFKIINKKEKMNKISKTVMNIAAFIFACFYSIIRNEINLLYGIIFVITMLSILFSRISKNNIINSILIIIISFSFNYLVFGVSSLVSFIPIDLLNIENRKIGVLIAVLIYATLINILLNVKRVKNGLAFLQKKTEEEYIALTVLTISMMILLVSIISSNYIENVTINIVLVFVMFFAMMITTIQKSLQLYYKQKLLVQELNETKDELSKKIKEVEELEAENLSFSKKSHSLAHKQKSLEHKLQEIINKTEISKEEAGEVKDRLEEINKNLYKEKTAVELSKTGITEIDDMLKYMQSECIANKIDFELQLKGNIHQMTNNFIAKEELEILLADHIKNAIIAINHTDNVNRSILVRLGKIDEIYSVHIYDSGIEFEKETLENLGKKPSTTHADEGGTGMGFMNTFDTLRKHKASLIIEEYNKPSKDNYTKAIIIKFDSKNEFQIKSYRQKEDIIVNYDTVNI